MKYTKHLFIIPIIFSIILFSGCNSTSDPYDEEIMVQLQEDTPFTIVIPTYFPKGMHLVQYGPPSKEVHGDLEYVQMYLIYQAGGLDKSIMITETNTKIIYAAPDTYINIEGNQIAEYTSKLTLEINGIGYDWNMNGVNFNVEIYGYDEEECENIISSMFPSE